MDKITVVIEGGIVQAVVSDNPAKYKNLIVQVLEYDTDLESDECIEIDQGNGTTVPASIGEFYVTEAGIVLP